MERKNRAGKKLAKKGIEMLNAERFKNPQGTSHLRVMSMKNRASNVEYYNPTPMAHDPIEYYNPTPMAHDPNGSQWLWGFSGRITYYNPTPMAPIRPQWLPKRYTTKLKQNRSERDLVARAAEMLNVGI